MSRSKRIGLALGAAVVVGLVWLASSENPFISTVPRTLLIAGALLLLLWLGWKLLRLFLWRVGRRLAFSYFLIGVIPIPMLVAVTLLSAYIITGFFVGHLYRDATRSLESDLKTAARARLTDFAGSGTMRPQDDEMIFGFYSNGRRVSGDRRTPAAWPEWLRDADEDQVGDIQRERAQSFVALPDGTIAQAVAVSDRNMGVVAVYAGGLEIELERRSNVFVRLLTMDDRDRNIVRVSIGKRTFPLRTFLPGGTGDEELGQLRPSDEAADPEQPWWLRPVIWWGEIAGPYRQLEDGAIVSEEMTASLNTTPANAYGRLFSSAAEVDAAAWAGLISVSGLLATIYGVALFMAGFMIFSLSRAVNRLSRATAAVQEGDFSVRMPVRRKDQVGDLQRSFNDMAAGLEQSVAAAAEQEIIENELEIARELQRSLIPRDIPSVETVEFATMFEPSAAIGGDYFDILRIDQERLAVVIADVAGHGLPTGLRMAMLKAALVILVEEAKPPEQILERLSDMIRSAEQQPRTFVTATVGVVHLGTGSLQLTNAGHPPTYVLRRGAVREIVLPGPPLGTLGSDYGNETVALEPGDLVVWLSDGLIEVTNQAGEPFGYERIIDALEGPQESPALVRNRLLQAIHDHQGDATAEDDKTLVVMRYSPPERPPSREA